ncbi:MAG: TonB family protein, partial [Vicinamibacteria bacterium]
KGGGIMKASEKAPTAEEAAPVPPKEAPKAEVAAPAPVKLIKPETATIKKGIAPVDLKKSVKEPKKQESREIALDRESMAAKPAKAAAVRTPGAATTNSGFDLTAQSPGVSDGSDSVSGPMAFYLAAAKNKIWANWLRQIRPDFSGIATVTFTIHRDGSIDEVQVIESSGSQTIDRLAERAVISTQLSPMPNSFEKDSLVIHANFKPVS